MRNISLFFGVHGLYTREHPPKFEYDTLRSHRIRVPFRRSTSAHSNHSSISPVPKKKKQPTTPLVVRFDFVFEVSVRVKCGGLGIAKRPSQNALCVPLLSHPFHTRTRTSNSNIKRPNTGSGFFCCISQCRRVFVCVCFYARMCFNRLDIKYKYICTIYIKEYKVLNIFGVC